MGGLTVIIGLISVPTGIELELIGTELGKKTKLIFKYNSTNHKASSDWGDNCPGDNCPRIQLPITQPI